MLRTARLSLLVLALLLASRTASADPGIVRVASGGRTFELEDGTPFVPVGVNLWPDTLDVRVRTAAELEATFRNLAEHRINVLRLLLEAAPKDRNVLVEDPPGTLTAEFTRWMDTMIRLAERHGVRLIVAVYPNLIDGPFGNWRFHPYASVLPRAHDLVATARGREMARRRIRLLVDGWGDSAAIFAWELANEFWIPDRRKTPKQNAAAHNAWIDEMGRYVAAYELSCHGRRHLRTVSTMRSDFPRRSTGLRPADVNVFTSEHLDFASYHAYGQTLLDATGSAGDWGIVVGNRIGPTRLVRAVRDTMGRMLARAPDRPVLCTEDFAFANPSAPGYANPWNPVRRMFRGYTDAERHDLFLAANWAYLASGAAGPTMRYPMGTFEDELDDRQLALVPFRRAVRWSSFRPRTACDRVRPARPDLIPLAVSDGRQTVAWLWHDVPFAARERIRTRVTFRGMAEEPHEVIWFDGPTGKRLRKQRAKGRRFTLRTPWFAGHLACVVRPR
jgi:hypothetical protein